MKAKHSFCYIQQPGHRVFLSTKSVATRQIYDVRFVSTGRTNKSHISRGDDWCYPCGSATVLNRINIKQIKWNVLLHTVLWNNDIFPMRVGGYVDELFKR